MNYTLEDIAQTLKTATQAKGLSQRSLSGQTGFTQANISKIENGTVDLKMSSLIELARALDLEVTLVPRRAMPAVRNLARISREPRNRKEISRIIASIKKVADLLSTAIPNHPAARKINDLIGDFEDIQPNSEEIEKLDQINGRLKMIYRSMNPSQLSDEASMGNARTDVIALMQQLLQMRNKIAHGASSQIIETPRPAYTLY